MYEANLSQTQAKQGRFLSTRTSAFTVAAVAPVVDLTETRIVEARKPASLTMFRRQVRPMPGATGGDLTAA